MSGRTEVSVPLAVAPELGTPFRISSCRASTRWRLSFSANPWLKSCSSLKVQQPIQSFFLILTRKEKGNQPFQIIFLRSFIHKKHHTLLIRSALINKVNNYFLLHSLRYFIKIISNQINIDNFQWLFWATPC